jgi:hypothetical protein
LAKLAEKSWPWLRLQKLRALENSSIRNFERYFRLSFKGFRNTYLSQFDSMAQKPFVRIN